jgi:flagellar biosynthesis/type III secretory pathway chaperone
MIIHISGSSHTCPIFYRRKVNQPVLVHVVMADGAVLQSLLQDSGQIVEFLAFDGEEVVDDECSALTVPPHAQLGPLRPRIEQIDHLKKKCQTLALTNGQKRSLLHYYAM